jgi:RNA polymerase sigma-70 factor (ECF subfamily)
MRDDDEVSRSQSGGETGGKRGGSGKETPLSLLERLRADDPGAWRRLMDLYRPLVLFWCARGGVTADDAEDIAQGVFAAAATGLGAFRRDRPGDTFRGWLRAVTRNQIVLHFRRNRSHVPAAGGSDTWRTLQDVADKPDVEDDGEKAEVGQVYRRAVEQARSEFEDRTWQAFWLVVVEGRAPADLIETLGMSPAAIRQAKARVLRRLKQEMGELLD